MCLDTSIAFSTPLNGFDYDYLTLIILFDINNFFVIHNEVLTSFAF